MERKIGSGELILASFFVVIFSFLNNSRSKTEEVDVKNIRKLLRAILLALAIFMVVAYTAINTFTYPSLNVVYIGSLVFTSFSVFLAWVNEMYLQEVKNFGR